MRPLAGITLLDLTRLLPGPYGAWLLRSWGARVIKVEDPEVGDYLRDLQPVWFERLNAGAESIALDLKQPADREIFLKLLPKVHGVMEGFRPGVMDRLGLSYATMRGANPQVVLISISGFPAGGEMAGRAGHDITYLARSGLLSLMGEMPPVQIADLTAGLLAAAGALAGVVGAIQSGQGRHVQVSLLESLFAMGVLQAADTEGGAPPVRGQLMLGGALGAYNVYETADGGRVALGALESKFWQGFCAAVERPDLADRHFDPDLKLDLAALFRQHPQSYWAAMAGRHDVCLEPVLSMAEAVQAHPDAQPVRFGEEAATGGSGAPRRGAQTQQILAEFGLCRQELGEPIDERNDSS